MTPAVFGILYKNYKSIPQRKQKFPFQSLKSSGRKWCKIERMFTYDVADVERIKPERSDSPAEKKNILFIN